MNFSMILAQADASAELVAPPPAGESLPAPSGPAIEAPVTDGATATETVAGTTEAPPADQPAPAMGGGGLWVYMLLFIALMYFMMIRPQRRREKERQAMLAAVKSGDRVLFGGGFIGTVSNVKEKTLMVKIADNVKVEIARGAVSQILQKGEAPDEGKQG